MMERFEADVVRAADGQLASWEEHPRGCLALIILLDQFSLNIYRDQARSLLQSQMAVPISLRAIERGFDQAVHPLERVFHYMPLEHSESMSVQNKCIELLKRLKEEALCGRTGLHGCRWPPVLGSVWGNGT